MLNSNKNLNLVAPATSKRPLAAAATCPSRRLSGQPRGSTSPGPLAPAPTSPCPRLAEGRTLQRSGSPAELRGTRKHGSGERRFMPMKGWSPTAKKRKSNGSTCRKCSGRTSRLDRRLCRLRRGCTRKNTFLHFQNRLYGSQNRFIVPKPTPRPPILVVATRKHETKCAQQMNTIIKRLELDKTIKANSNKKRYIGEDNERRE